MKKVFLLVMLVAGILFGAEAQNRSINFEQTKVWKQIVKKAKKEKKLIFVDCYTSWCGPCKMLANNVFTKDEVADYFNQTFVNAKYDMEKDEDGIILKTQSGVKAFPTLVFVDPSFPITPPRFAPFYRTSSPLITVPKALPWQMNNIFIIILFLLVLPRKFLVCKGFCGYSKML